MNITFIGMGLMGIPMAKNIITKWYPLTVYNRTPGKVEELVSLWVVEIHNIEEALRNADIIISMVTAGSDVEGIIDQGKGALKPWAIWIDMSTIGVNWAKKIARQLASVGVSFIDAPVTGSTPKAITGELTIFIGWDAEAVERSNWVLSAMGTNLQYMGAVGMGQAMKLVNNTLVAYSMIGLAEVMKLAESMGMEASRTAEVIKTIPVASAYTAMKIDNFVKHQYPLMFSVANMSKDIDLAYEMMHEGNISLEYLTYAHELYQKWVSEWFGGEDLSAIEKVI